MRRSVAAAPAERSPRSFWFDPRFGIGLGLVVASVLGVVALVTAADSTEEVWAARTALSPGDEVDGDDLVLRGVRLGEAGGLYLGGAALPPDGVVVTRAVAAGELVPASAVGETTAVDVASVVLRTGGSLPHSVGPGAVVDVWSTPTGDADVLGAPSVLVGDATVVRILDSEGLIVDGESTAVEVLVPRERIAVVLAAVADDSALSLVPVAQPLED